LTDTSERRRRLTGIALMCGAIACFSCNDTAAKFLNHYMDSLEVVWARFTGAFLLAFVVSNPLTRPGLLMTSRPLLQIGRSVLLLGSTVTNVFALRYLQLDQAQAIMFSTPFFLALLAGPLLGEWFGWRRWTAIWIGFLGVLAVTRPGAGGIHPAALLSLAGALCYALYSIITRLLARTDSTETTLFYSNLVGAVATVSALPFVWTTPRDGIVIAAMIAMGAFASLGHYLLIAAHRLTPVSVLAPFIYAQLIGAIAFGYLVFGDVPNRWTLSGAAIVTGCGLYLLYRERKVKGLD